MKCFKFTSPNQKQKTALKGKLEKLNSRIDKMIEKCETDKPEYQQLLKLHKTIFYDIQ